MEKFIATCALLCVLAALTYGSNDAGNPPAPPANIKTVIIAAVPDTIPATEKATSKKSKEVELIVEDGEIQSLKIDGETIPKSDYERYKDLTNNLIEESEITPPAPPAPPAPGYRRNMPVPPAPPAPAYPGHMPVPPAPPVPPVRGFSFDYQFAPEVRSFSGDNIQYHKTDDGRTVIIIDSDGRGENSEIRVEDGVVYLNGKRVESAAPEISEDILLRQYGYPYAPAIPEMRHLMELYTPEALAPYDALLWSEEGHKNRAKEMDKMRKEHKRAMKEHLKMREMMKKEQLEMMKKQKGLSGIEQQLEMEHAARLEADMRRQAELQMADIQMQELNGLISQEALREMEAALDAQDIAMSVDMPDLAEREASFIGSDFKNALEEHLMQDGFLKSRSGYKFRLSGNALTINGEKQSAEMFEKYKSLYESLTEQTLCDGCTIELSKSGTAPAPATRL